MSDQDLTEKITNSVSQMLYKTTIYSKARFATNAMYGIAFLCGINLCLAILINYKCVNNKKNSNRIFDVIKNINKTILECDTRFIEFYNNSPDSFSKKLMYDISLIKDDILILHTKIDILTNFHNKPSLSDFSTLTDDAEIEILNTYITDAKNTNNNTNGIINNIINITKQLTINDKSYNKINSEDDDSYIVNELLDDGYDNMPCNNNKKINILSILFPYK